MLPSINPPERPVYCEECGDGPLAIVDPPFCPECDDRLAAEKRRESASEYRRQAQIRLELAQVRQRVTRHLRGE